MTHLIVNGRGYNIRRWGDGSPVVMLHGFMGSAADWEAVAGRLSQQYEVIAVDLLGFGASDKLHDVRAYAMESVASDLHSLIGSLTTVPAHLVGYSMGGRLALYMLWCYPEQFTSATLESASPGLQTSEERIARAQSDQALADRIEQNGVEAFVDFWEALPLWASQDRLSDAARAQQRRQRLANDPVGLANSLRGMGTGVQPALWDYLPDIDLPVQLIAGQLDSKFVTINTAMQGLLPRAEMTIIPDCGHNTHLESEAVFTDHLIRFLSEQRS